MKKKGKVLPEELKEPLSQDLIDQLTCHKVFKTSAPDPLYREFELFFKKRRKEEGDLFIHTLNQRQRNTEGLIHAFYTKHGEAIFNIDINYLKGFCTIYTIESKGASKKITAALSFSCS